MILDKFSLKGKVAIVTGASSGLGQGIAAGLAEAGADIAGVARGEMKETGEIIDNIGRNFLPIKADLSSLDAVDKVIGTTLDKLGKIDILVNNAGTIRRGPCIGFSEEDWDVVFDVNLRTPFFLTQSVAEYLVNEKKKGKIINVVSMLSFQGGILVPSYTASKSALAGLTKAMCNEWAQYNINVNGIAPGYMETELTEALRKDSARNKAILERIPAGQWGSPEDLKGAAVYLASEASDYVNGYILAVDGGWLAR